MDLCDTVSCVILRVPEYMNLHYQVNCQIRLRYNTTSSSIGLAQVFLVSIWYGVEIFGNYHRCRG